MRISNIEKVQQGDTCELRAVIESPSLKEPFVLWYRFSAQMAEVIDPNNGDPWVAVGLLPAMRTGETLEVSAPVSPRLLWAANKIQDIYKCWDHTLNRLTINCAERDPSLPITRPSGVGLFFSLGVDSFYSLLKNMTHPDEHGGTITHLIVVHGFDIYYGKWNTDLFTVVRSNSAKMAQLLGMKILPVATNIRDLSDRFADWGVLYHGAAMTSIALVLESVFKKVYIAASNSYARLHPWGTYPVLDPLWATETLSFVHDGCEANRLDKVRFISQFPITLETLRVCFMNPNNEYNCGRCEKCLRTMICLHIAGVLQKCKTLPSFLDLELVRNIAIQTHYERTRYQEIINALGSSERDLAIKAALEECLSRSKG